MKVIIMHNTVTTHDAIGNDIEAEYRILSKIYDCHVYAPNKLNYKVTYIEREELDELLDEPDTVLLYHHSVFWNEGYEILKKAKGKIIFKYHNITPAHYFEPYNEFSFQQCKRGREQTNIYQEEFPDAYWISDSKYNALDLTGVPQERQGICPPFNKMEEWGRKIPNEQILKSLLESDNLNVLFIGRVAPNKGHLMLVDVLKTYCQYYGRNIKLRIIGKFDDSIQGYNDLVKQKIQDSGLESNIEFVGELNDNILMSYYLGSDILLCCSEHEGFCVPVVEAQFFNLPVIALRQCAVPETIGDNQILLQNSPLEFASALKVLQDCNEYRDFLVRKGKENFNTRFAFELIKTQFMEEFQKGLE